MAKSPIFNIIKLLFNPQVSNKIILQIAYQQVPAIGISRIIPVLLSTAIVGVSSVIKVPQIKKIVNQKSLKDKIEVVNGLSLESINLELISQLVHLSYNLNCKTAFINYGETFLLGLQNLIIKFLISYYQLRWKLSSTNLSEEEQINETLTQLLKPLIVNLGIILLVIKVLPMRLVSFLQILNIPISIASKLPQIRKNYLLKSTRHLSTITVGANSLGSLIRIFTTLHNKVGLILLLSYSSSFALNSVLVGQCYYYNQFFKAGSKNEEDIERKKNKKDQ